MTRVIAAGVAQRLGIPLRPSRAKFASSWTYYRHLQQFHTTGRDCPVANPTICPVCSDAIVKADRAHWYQSRTEALFAQRLDTQQAAGDILRWERGRSVVVLDAKTRHDRLTYKPDFFVTLDVSASAPCGPHLAIEVKGGRAMIDTASKMRIRLYRALVARGEQPPLKIMRPDRQGAWREIVL